MSGAPNQFEFNSSHGGPIHRHDRRFVARLRDGEVAPLLDGIKMKTTITVRLSGFFAAVQPGEFDDCRTDCVVRRGIANLAVKNKN